MFPSKWRKSAKLRFIPTLELLEKRNISIIDNLCGLISPSAIISICVPVLHRSA